MIGKLIIGVWLVAMLSGCSVPGSPAPASRIDPAVAFASVQADPTRFSGQSLLTGGSIVSLTDDGEGSMLEILRWEMSRCGGLLALANDGTHLLVRSPSRLDKEEFAVGRLVTLCGRIAGTAPRPGDAHGETALRLDLDEIYLMDTPFRYGLHRNTDPGIPQYVPPKGLGANHPYDPTHWAYPYSPFWYRLR